MFTLSDFDYALPVELIAQIPTVQRTGSRLLHVPGKGLEDLRFAQFAELMHPGDLVVFNDTRVINARVFAHKATGGRVEILVERIIAAAEAWVQLRASHAPKDGSTLHLPGGAQATVVRRDARFFRLLFEGTGSLIDWLDRFGEVPLPPTTVRLKRE